MKGRRHLRRVFAVLLMLITVISLISSSAVYVQFYRKFLDNVSENLTLTGESIAQTLSADFLSRTAAIFSELAVNSTYEALQAFSLNMPASAQLEAFELFKRITLDLSIYSEILLYYPDENLVMGRYGGILSLDRYQNQALYTDLLNSLPALSQRENKRWAVLDASKLPAVMGNAIALAAEVSFWDKYARPPIAVFMLDTAALRLSIKNYATDDIILSVCSSEGGVFLSTADALSADRFYQRVNTRADNEWSDDSFAHVRVPMGNTGLSLVLSTSLSYYSKSTRPLLMLFVLLNAAIFLAGIVVSWLLANKLYSPMRQLTDAISDMYSPPSMELAEKGENGFVLSAFDAIHSKLTDMGEMVEANLPYLRSAVMHDLFHNSQFIGEHTPDLHAAARVRLPYDAYCVVAVRIFSADLSALGDVERSVAPYTLLSRMENCAQGMAVHGYNDDGKLLLLINAPEGALAHALERIERMLDAYAREKRVRTHIYRSEAFEELSEISLAAQELEGHFFDNFFDAPVEGASIPDMSQAHLSVIAAVQSEDWAALELKLNDFISAISGCPPQDALLLLRQLGLALMPRLPDAKQLTRAENTRIFNLLISPQQRLWSISEYPRALREVIEDIVKSHAQPAQETNELIAKVRDYVIAHMSEPVSRDELAAAMHFNPSYFSTLFKAQCAVPVSQFILSIKMERAVFLLLGTGYTVGEISEQTGFSSPQYFIRKFRDQYGLTPAEFRKRQMT